MASGMAIATANAFLNSICRGSAYSVSQLYMQLHTGAPGSAGTSATALETTRKTVGFGAAANGSISNSAAITWTNISGSQDATQFTLWDNTTNGNFVGSGDITANAYTAGDTYNIAIGAATLSFTTAS